MEYVGLISSFAMGIILGLMGGGGSILTVPILVYLFSLSPTVATGYSLFVVGTAALIGSVMYFRNGDIDFRAGVAFAALSVTGVNFSRGFIVPQIPAVITQMDNFVLTKEILVMIAFAVLMIVASTSMIRRTNVQKSIEVKPLARLFLVAMVGAAVGIIAGFVGAGGGFLIIPALVFMAGLPMRTAVGTSLMVIASQSLLGFLGDIFRGLVVDWPRLLTLSAVAAIGIVVGSAVAHKIKEQKVKSAFGWFTLVMGITILLEQLHRLYFV